MVCDLCMYPIYMCVIANNENTRNDVFAYLFQTQKKTFQKYILSVTADEKQKCKTFF